MKTNNFIKGTKKALQNSTVQPSENAWEKMNIMLDQAARKKRRKKLIFWTYAAAFVGLLFGLTFLFKRNNTQLNTHSDTIVIQDTINIKSTKQKVLKEITIKEELVASQKEEAIQEQVSYNVKIKKHNSTDNNSQQQPTKYKNDIVVPVPIKAINNEVLVATNTAVKSVEKDKAKNKKPLFNTSDESLNNMLAAALKKENTSKKYQLKVAENTLQKTAATKGDMTINKFFKNMIKAGVDTAENIITANDN